MDNFNTPGEHTGRSFTDVAHSAAFILLSANIILSPWCYGSWEQWWFWPMMLLLLAAGFCSGVGALAESILPDALKSSLTGRFRSSRKIAALGIAAAPFLLYALARSQYPSGMNRPLVALHAERSLLLLFSPVLIAFVSFLSLTRRRLRILFAAMLANIAVIAFYGALMRLCCAIFPYPDDPKAGLDLVLWTRLPYYFGRAKGTFYCPSHFSAFINFGICILTAIAFLPPGKNGISLKRRIAAGAAALLLLFPNSLSQSRGGMISLALALAIGIPAFAMRGYKRSFRILAPLGFIALICAAFFIMLEATNVGNRLKSNSVYRVLTDKSAAEKSETLGKRISNAFWYDFDRGQYIDSALRAWKSNPIVGIGPGQHAVRWPEFDATRVTHDGSPIERPVDGDLTTMRRPRLTNDSVQLYEVHSDWTQLLEEFGVIGILLFLPLIVLLMISLYGNQTLTLRKAEISAAKQNSGSDADAENADAEGDGDDDDGEEEDEEEIAARRAATRRTRRRRRHSRNHRVRDTIPWRSGESATPFELSFPLAAMLCALVIIIHSLGDFSLQIPSLTWMLSFILTAGILSASKTHR